MNTHRASMITRVGPLAALSLTAAALLALALPACSGEGDEQQGDCPADEEFYEREVWDAFASMTCYGCHNPEGTAKATRMILDPDDVAHNMEVMATLAAEQVDGASLLLLKPTMTHPDGHGGGMVLKPDSPEYAALAEFVARADGSFVCEDGEGEAPSCEEIGAGPRALRRLSHVEYDNSVQDLLGVSGELGAQAASFAPDNVINGFTNNASALTVSSLLVEQYREAAEALADHVVENQAQYLSCAPADGQSCAESFVRSFGARAFRRPVTDEEVARYAALYQAIAPEDGFDVGLRWVVAALLQSPNFLYRSELGEHQGDGVYALTPHEVAAELSYLVLGTTPDEELRALAEDGTILDPAVLEAQAQRLLADPRSERTLSRFVDEWLGVSLLPIVTRDPTLYPEFTPAIRAAMLGELHRVVDDVFRSGGTLAELMTADYTYATDELAAYYGISGGGEADAEGFKKIPLDGETYGGLLTLGAMNAAHAKPTSSSPIHRGVLVRERLLCQELPPPPPSLDTSPPPVDPNLSTRERYLQHSTDPACKGCHELIDGIGFGLEHYDAIGRYRLLDGVHMVDATGEIVRSQDVDGVFDGHAGLQSVLAGADEVGACYTRLWMEYSLGAEIGGELDCVEDELLVAFNDSGGQLDALVMALVRSPHFVIRGGGATVGDPGDPGDPTSGGTTGGDTGMDTTGGTTSGGTTGDPGTGGDTGTSEGIEVEVVTDSMWEQGECDTVHVHNVTDAPITWEVHLALGGNLTNYWNAKVTPDGANSVFVGEDYNAIVDAQGTTSFGFCIEY